jgi:hypothetical protein
MCACAPTLKPLLARFFPRWFEMSSFGSGSYGSSGGYSNRVKARNSFIELERSKNHEPRERPYNALPHPSRSRDKRIQVTTNIEQSTWFDERDSKCSPNDSGAGFV